MGYRILYPRVEWYPEGLDIFLVSEGLDLIYERSRLNLPPGWLPSLVMFFLDQVDLLQEEPDGWIGGWQVITKALQEEPNQWIGV